jgi:alpha-galactosidase
LLLSSSFSCFCVHWQVGDAGLSLDEARSHMAAWCVVAAPLLISNDIVSGLDNETLAILSAPEVIAVDQVRTGGKKK